MTTLIQEQIAHEQTKMELYKSQFQMLDMMGRASMSKIEGLQKVLSDTESQARFDSSVDARDIPSGATKQPDQFSGS